jgi:hypothetical protein
MLDVRDKIALHFLSCMSDADIEWCVPRLEEWKKEVHYGDCTKAPITCNRCVADEAYRRADALVAELKE